MDVRFQVQQWAHGVPLTARIYWLVYVSADDPLCCYAHKDVSRQTTHVPNTCNQLFI